MAALAIIARPRLVAAAALFGLTLLAGHEPRPAATPAAAAPPPAIRLALQPSSDLLVAVPSSDPGMVVASPGTADHLNTAMQPLADWISDLVLKLAGDAC